MASTNVRIGQQALAVLDVALRVPCIFIIDAIFNSYHDPWTGWAGTAGRVLIRVFGKLPEHYICYMVSVERQNNYREVAATRDLSVLCTC